VTLIEKDTKRPFYIKAKTSLPYINLAAAINTISSNNQILGFTTATAQVSVQLRTDLQ
jgi:hypothetical protein